MRVFKFFILIQCLFWILLSESHASRVVYLPPVVATLRVGGYDTTISPKKYCTGNADLKDRMATSTLIQNKRVSGLYGSFVVALRNLSKTSQTVKLIVESVQFDVASWAVAEEGLPDNNFLRDFTASNASGLSVGATPSFVLPAEKSASIYYEYGCQGTSANNNCFLRRKQISINGTSALAAANIFGTPWESNMSSSGNALFLCYGIGVVIQSRLQVDQDIGAITGAVSVDDFGAAKGGAFSKSDGITNYEINGGRAF